MFDSVDCVLPCYACGAMLDSFQSKDGRCVMETIPTTAVSTFYTSCHKCKAWNEYKRFSTPTSDLLNFDRVKEDAK